MNIEYLIRKMINMESVIQAKDSFYECRFDDVRDIPDEFLCVIVFLISDHIQGSWSHGTENCTIGDHNFGGSAVRQRRVGTSVIDV